MYVGLTKEQIREIHEYILAEHGGFPGEKDPGLIDSMAIKPFTEYFGQEQYPGLFLKAAVNLHGFAVATYCLYDDQQAYPAFCQRFSFQTPPLTKIVASFTCKSKQMSSDAIKFAIITTIMRRAFN